MNRRLLWTVLMLATVATVAGLNGCEGCAGNPKSGIVVSFSVPPPATATEGQPYNMTATVTGDRLGKGVNWTCTPVNSCGSFVPASTGSGVSTAWTAPGTAGMVTITATSISDNNKFASATVNVTAAAQLGISFTVPPPAQMEEGATVSITAATTNDPMGGGVNWSCMPTGSCGMFSAANTASGSPVMYTAPGSVTTVTIIATAADDTSKTAQAMVSILAPNLKTFTFYLSGLENFDEVNSAPNLYVVVGAVTIDFTTGLVTGGEEDYDDAIAIALQAQPITGGALNINSNGQGTLTLETGLDFIGPNNDGTETLGVQFVNNNHALITQYDASATSSGSLDLQTSTSTPTGTFAFALSGVDSGYNPIAVGGITSFVAGNLQSSIFDINDAGNVTTGASFGVNPTVNATDPFGRGTITGTGFAGNASSLMAYYVVGPEALRLIVVDAADEGVGSAFGQGDFADGYDNGTLGASVFGIGSNSWGLGETFGNLYQGAGQFATSNTGLDPADFTGIADEDELFGSADPDVSIGGTYSIALTGYGSMTFNTGCLQDVCSIGIYMVDKDLNINDPNNTTTDLGGALIVDLDDTQVGTGFLVPQTNTATAQFSGNYGFGGQNYIFPQEITNLAGWEFDFLGQGNFNGSFTSAPGLISDPFDLFGTNNAQISNATFSITPVADGANPGHYDSASSNLTVTPTPAFITGDGDGSFALPTGIYQADGGELVWVSLDFLGNPVPDFSSFGGVIQQQTLPITTPTITPGVKIHAPAKINSK